MCRSESTAGAVLATSVIAGEGLLEREHELAVLAEAPSVLRKLSVRTRAQAGAEAVRLGLAQVD
jgi:hypothetical protein